MAQESTQAVTWDNEADCPWCGNPLGDTEPVEDSGELLHFACWSEADDVTRRIDLIGELLGEMDEALRDTPHADTARGGKDMKALVWMMRQVYRSMTTMDATDPAVLLALKVIRGEC